jgi:hypothetical protein
MIMDGCSRMQISPGGGTGADDGGKRGTGFSDRVEVPAATVLWWPALKAPNVALRELGRLQPRLNLPLDAPEAATPADLSEEQHERDATADPREAVHGGVLEVRDQVAQPERGGHGEDTDDPPAKMGLAVKPGDVGWFSLVWHVRDLLAVVTPG